jgi:hypothetical protein
MTRSIVLEPDVGFDAVAAALGEWDGGPADRHGWLAGEPISANWTRGGREVHYSANPAINLRVLSGSGAADAAAALPALQPERIRALARSEDLESALLGITAAGLCEDLGATGDLEALAGDERPEVAAAASLALRRLGATVLQVGADRIAERRRRAPGRDPVFGLLGPPEARRQLIRELTAAPPATRARRLELVRAALHDDDWEVRWSAVLAAHDLRLAELLLDIRQCARADRAHRVDREILEALREAVGRRLAGSEPSLPGALRVLAILDGAREPYDRASALIGALRRPLPATEPGPAPEGFSTVPAVPHQLGDPEVPGAPPRTSVPARPIAIRRDVLPDVPAAGVPEALDALSARLGARLRLPSPDELEMAARGPDGRRHPWGNGRERRTAAVDSPWGLRRPLDGPEWVARDGELLALGPAHECCCGPLGRPASAALRPVLDR